MLLIRKLVKIMESMIYVRTSKADEPFVKTGDLGYVNPVLKGFRLMFWPNDTFKDDKASFWLERGEGYNWDTIIQINCSEFGSVENMACMIISAVNFCDKIGS